MQEPLVSIIMGAYNCEDTISECIDSILNQTYSNWEFIICNDCSNDRTKEILKIYQKKDTRIIIINNEKNLKLAATLNRCLNIAQGKYIARMDADDISLPERLEKQVKFMERYKEYDVVGCNRIIFDENGDKGIRKSIEYPTKKVLLKDVPFAHPTILMKKSVYDYLGGYKSSKHTIRAEDAELWFRFYENNYQGYNIQEALYKYREGINDFRKRSIKAGMGTAVVFWNGYKKIHISWYKRIFAIKPIIVALIPNKVMKKYHTKNLQ